MKKYAVFKIIKSKLMNMECSLTKITECYIFGIRVYYKEYKE